MDTTHSLKRTTGQVFAGYTIVRVLGAGGMGNVYLATHPRLPREDALKVLPPNLTADPEFRARFEREAELAASLSHPHIVGIHDRGEQDGQFWISMDYVAGTDAARLLREQYPGGMQLAEVVTIITAVASALDYAHYRGLLHRDVKPAKILLTDPGMQARQVYLADFGIARHIDDVAGLTQTNMTLGTVNYAAPEQLKGELIDGRADQYALACSAFHLLAGVPPYGDSNPAVVITQHVSAPPPSIGAYRPELAALDPAFATAMAKEPAGRFGSCREFAGELAKHLISDFAYAGEIPNRPDAPRYTQPAIGLTAPAMPAPASAGGNRSRRHAGILVGAFSGVALLIAGGVFAAEKLTQHHNPGTPAASTATAPSAAAPAPNTGPLTGVYRADFGRVSSIEGDPVKTMPQTAETWGFRSVCGSAGCVATASRLSGETMEVSTMVFDQVAGGWVAVGLGSGECNKLRGELWEVFRLQSHPDGTLSGESNEILTKGCANKRTVTFTRMSDVDINSLSDPATLPPRVVSPAEALFGRYHQTSRQPNGFREQGDYVVRTDCLRTGDRCMSFFHAPPAKALALVFADGSWIYDREFDAPCSRGGVTHAHFVVPFPLPQPALDPVPTIAGHGHEELTGAPGCGSTDVDVKFARTGD